MPSTKSIARESFKLLCLILVVIALIYFFYHGGNLAETLPARSALVNTRSTTNAQVALCGPPSQDAHTVSFEMVYSDDMRAWIDPAIDAFSHRCPNIEVKLIAVPDIEAADAILAGQLKPVLWAPTDELSLRYLDYLWKQRGGALPFQAASSTSLVESPLVLLIWQDWLRLLSALLHEERSAEGLWVRGPCAQIPRQPDITGVPIEAMLPGTWLDWYAPLVAPLIAPQPEGRPKPKGVVTPPPLRPIGDEPLPSLDEAKTWGRVKIGHAKPTSDSGGTSALYLMAYDYILPPNERQTLVQEAASEPAPATDQPRVRDERIMLGFEKSFAVQKPDLGKWLRRCEAGLDAPPSTTSALTTALFDVGPSLYDGVVTYEHLVLPLLGQVDSHADALRKLTVLYPDSTLLARHPAVFFDASAEEQAAAHRWLDFLLSKEMQEKAIEAGFRPVNREVTIGGYDVEKNQFLRLRRYGVLLQPQLTEAPRPDGSRVQDLLNLWGEVTGRN